MADIVPAAIDDDHPLALELSSLRAAASRYQREAHAASLKLQRHSLEVSRALDHARALESENAHLKEEVAVLRANPDATPTPTASQVPELTLALRRLSDKLTSVEETLLARTEEVAGVRSELAGAHHELEAARALAAEARAREEEGLARERVLEQNVQAAEEERRMADLVVQEYANLVRKLEGRAKATPTHSSTSSISSVDVQRSANGSATTLVDSLAEGKLGLQKLLEEFNGRNEQLQGEIAQLHGDNALLYKELGVARQGAKHDRDELAKALHELDKYRADDNTATKMVSRYMKFSQSSTDTLQKAMDALKARHIATLSTLNAEIAQLQRGLIQEREESERVRIALDELTEDIAREAYGRRCEVSLRLAFLGREENLAENLRRWVRKAKESFERSSGSEDGSISLNPMALREAFAKSTEDAETLLSSLDGQPSEETDSISIGSIARLVLAQDTVASLTRELQGETVRRLNSERRMARMETVEHPGESHDSVHTSPVVQPMPLHIAQERLDVGVSASTTEPPSASPLQIPVDEITPPESMPIVEVVTVTSVVPADGSARSGPLPTTPDEPSPSALTDPPVPSTSTCPPTQAQNVLDLSVSDGVLPETTQSGLTESSPTYPQEASEVTTKESPSLTDDEGGSRVVFPSTPELPASESQPGRFPAPPSAIPLPNHVQHSASVPSPEFCDTLQTSNPDVPSPLSLPATGLTLSSLSPGFTSATLPAGESKELSLLADFTKVKHRYDDVQLGFRDCHLALKELRKSLNSLPLQPISSPSDMSSVLRRAVERLSDFTEDARVELEIRIADEERIASGYEALLSIPGAMATSDNATVDKMDESEIIKEVLAFVDGTDSVIAKAMRQFTQKLDDLEHDIATIKRTLFDLTSSDDAHSPSSSVASPSWSAWTPSFLSPPRSTSPAPTFGSVMTSPRLRHSTSFSHPRERSSDESSAPTDPLASLGLRIVVPARSPAYNPNPTGVPRAGSRQRATSGMFMLGLGMRSTSASFGPGMGQRVPSRSSLANSGTASRRGSVVVPGVPSKDSPAMARAEDDGAAGGNDSDVE